MDDHTVPRSYWHRYISALWWVFALAATILIIVIAGLYLELVTGNRLFDWCTATCGTVGALSVAIWIYIAHWLRGDRDDIGQTKRHLESMEERMLTIENATERLEGTNRWE